MSKDKKFNIGDYFYIVVKIDSECCEIFKGIVCSYCYNISGFTGDASSKFWLYEVLILNSYPFIGDDKPINEEKSVFHELNSKAHIVVHGYDLMSNTLHMSAGRDAEKFMHETIECAEKEVEIIAKEEWGEDERI